MHGDVAPKTATDLGEQPRTVSYVDWQRQDRADDRAQTNYEPTPAARRCSAISSAKRSSLESSGA
jgi:hypothetical protein